MFAIVETGGKQYRVQEGLEIKVEKLDVEPAKEIVLDKVLVVGEGAEVKIGTPYVDGAKVVCEVLGHGRGKKIIVFKKKRRKGYRKKQGHRQWFTALRIKEIQA
ncbi:50S ribosomal protein L21 [Desulfonauticus submarinus]|uniref:Large ribosomal subunit protein bL21 n=1 Tax=Desulfonauticus submarinus TaxID=206665 RepID=A0A1H0F2T2_9BACT|nr:50S ribosomal protein L21 [Desulfonauticus submarinus]SDN88978.1 large subunit ribosomal protein L21 [Desulfonauticus submarinus]